jgi:ATP-dependent RNA helicase SUPV3L1/SUV3
MTFQQPFFCTDLKEMIELAEMVEQTDEHDKLSPTEIFGFACAPVNMGLIEHVQYYLWIIKHYVDSSPIFSEPIEYTNEDIDYLETSIKCVELYQWLSRHFSGKNFEFEERRLLENKAKAVEKLNSLLSEKTTKTCASCGCKLDVASRFPICDSCFSARRTNRRFSRGGERESAPREGRGGGDRGRSRDSSRIEKPTGETRKDPNRPSGPPRGPADFGVRPPKSGGAGGKNRRRRGGGGGKGGGAHGIPRA